MDIDKQLEAELNFTHIPYKEKMEKSIKELMDTDPSKVMKW